MVTAKGSVREIVLAVAKGIVLEIVMMVVQAGVFDLYREGELRYVE